MKTAAGWIQAARAFLIRLACHHREGVLVAIEWDGTAVYECTCCGKHIFKGLR